MDQSTPPLRPAQFSLRVLLLCTLLAGPLVAVLLAPAFNHRRKHERSESDRYERIPILGPTTSGGAVGDIDPPNSAEIWQAVKSFVDARARRLGPGEIGMTLEPVAEYIDPPRLVPGIGHVQPFHTHYKVTIYYSAKDIQRSCAVYIDHMHYHLIGTAP